jgi:MOSC domain-containing protein YiiM
MTGILEGIYISPAAGVLPRAVPNVRLIAGLGLEGDRYAAGLGSFSGYAGCREVTLIEAEALEAFASETGVEFSAAHSRRNLVTRGVRLNHLVGLQFRVGCVTLRGLRLCEPCRHLATLTTNRVLPGLVHRGGLYAEIVVAGLIGTGDKIETLDNH